MISERLRIVRKVVSAIAIPVSASLPTAITRITSDAPASPNQPNPQAYCTDLPTPPTNRSE
jgi:hypothetical protein